MNDLVYNGTFRDCITLYYDVGFNRFFTEEGELVINIYSLLTPNQIWLFRCNKEPELFIDITGKKVITLVYPEYWYWYDDMEEEDDYID